MQNDPRNTMPGDRVLVFNHRLYKNDIDTPSSMTNQPATVLCRYGKKSIYHFNCVHDHDFNPICEPSIWIYPDLVDVLFDSDPRPSHGHFTTSVTSM